MVLIHEYYVQTRAFPRHAPLQVLSPLGDVMRPAFGRIRSTRKYKWMLLDPFARFLSPPRTRAPMSSHAHTYTITLGADTTAYHVNYLQNRRHVYLRAY
jgi:hypothetical protein